MCLLGTPLALFACLYLFSASGREQLHFKFYFCRCVVVDVESRKPFWDVTVVRCSFMFACSDCSDFPNDKVVIFLLVCV